MTGNGSGGSQISAREILTVIFRRKIPIILVAIVVAAAALSARRHVIWVERPYRRILSIMPTLYDDLWTAGKGFGAVTRAVNRALEVKEAPPYLLLTLRYLFMAFSVSILMIASIAITVTVVCCETTMHCQAFHEWLS